MNTVNLSELSATLEVCSRAPQLPVLYELSLRLSLHLLGSHILLEEQGAVYAAITHCCSALWDSSVAERSQPGEITTHPIPAAPGARGHSLGLGNRPRAAEAACGQCRQHSPVGCPVLISGVSLMQDKAFIHSQL